MRPLNQCTGCGKAFASLEAFDAHRVGKHPQTGPSEYAGSLEDWTPEQGRRCLTLEEMRQGSFRARRFVTDARPRLVLARSQGRARNGVDPVSLTPRLWTLQASGRESTWRRGSSSHPSSG